MAVNREDIAGPLRERIVSGEYAPGDKLPSTRELATSYNAARATANAALQLLAREGLIALRDKSGAVVVGSERVSSPDALIAEARTDLQDIRDAVRETRRYLDELDERVSAALAKLKP
jgi:DNA-binding GntR family transcriptional regulator